MNYYNEYDPAAAAWLRELISRKLIPAGTVDDRSILEVTPSDLDGFTQCHFFAGIGGWSLALQLAGWPDTRPVWTASLPCQPFSVSGKGQGAKDDRHLWPVFNELVKVKRPERIFGEQVARAIGFDWLDGISANLEAESYTVGAVVLGAHSVNAPHQRQRLYWLADTENTDRGSELATRSEGSRRGRLAGSGAMGGRMADSISKGLQGHSGNVGDRDQPGRINAHAAGSTAAGGTTGSRVANAPSGGLGIVGHAAQPGGSGHADGASGAVSRLGESNSDGRQPGNESTTGARHGGSAVTAGFWSDSRWIYCRDGKHRRIPTEPALFPLSDGIPYKLARRGSIRPALLKGAGNAIVPEVAAEFIRAYIEVTTP